MKKFIVVYYKPCNRTLFFDLSIILFTKRLQLKWRPMRGALKCGFVHLYQVWPPLAVMTAQRQLVIDWHTFQMVLWGIFRYSSNKVLPNYCGFIGWGCLPTQLVPQMLDMIQVWGHSGSIENVGNVRLKKKMKKKVWCQSCRVSARIVLLEN